MKTSEIPATGQVVHTAYPDRYRIDMWQPGHVRGQWVELPLSSASLPRAIERAAAAANAHQTETRVRDTRPETKEN